MIMIPKVTIAIPTIGRMGYFEETIKSAINQTYEDIEIIISDNASTDETQVICRSYSDNSRITYFRQNDRLSMVDNWNFLLTKATGKYFLLLSDDDLLEENMIKQFITELEKFKDNDVSLAYCPVKYIDQDGKYTSRSSNSPVIEDGYSFIKASLLYERTVFSSSALMNTEILKTNYGFDKSSQFGTDMIARFNIAANHEVICINIPMVKYRRHSNSLSNSLQAVKSHENLFKYLKSDKFIYNNSLSDEIDYYIRKTKYILIRQLIIFSDISFSDLSKLKFYKSLTKFDHWQFRLFSLIPFRTSIYRFYHLLKASIKTDH